MALLSHGSEGFLIHGDTMNYIMASSLFAALAEIPLDAVISDVYIDNFGFHTVVYSTNVEWPLEV